MTTSILNTCVNTTSITDGCALRYVETNNETGEPTGRGVTFSGVDFKPLGYVELIGKKLNETISIPLVWDRAHVTESTIPEITVEKFASGQADLCSPFTSKTIGLVKGGWLPPGLALQNNMIILPDRCTVSELKSRYKDGKKRSNKGLDFMDFFIDQPVKINPMLFAMEGNLKEPPSPDLIERQLCEAHAKLSAALPLAELVPAGKSGLQGVIGLVQDSLNGMEHKQEFLIRIAPRLHAPVSSKRTSLLWDEIFTLARDCSVPQRSLVVLAALSAATVPNGKSPAKRLLKLSKNYTNQNAYNALSDLRSLELLITLFSLYPNERMMLCTGDKDLALFWTGIGASEFTMNNGAAECNLSVVDALLPNMTNTLKSYLA